MAAITLLAGAAAKTVERCEKAAETQYCSRREGDPMQDANSIRWPDHYAPARCPVHVRNELAIAAPIEARRLSRLAVDEDARGLPRPHRGDAARLGRARGRLAHARAHAPPPPDLAGAPARPGAGRHAAASLTSSLALARVRTRADAIEPRRNRCSDASLERYGVQVTKRAVRSRTVQSPKVKSSIPLEKIDRAIRVVTARLSASPAKSRSKRPERARAGQR